MEDDHVDRPDVQARQRVELTGTNRPTGLIALMIHARAAHVRLTADLDGSGSRQTRPSHSSPQVRPDGLPPKVRKHPRQARPSTSPEARSLDLRRPGGSSEAPPPDPIPNSAVKRLSAQGTVPQGTGEQVAAGPAKINTTHTVPHHDPTRWRKPADAGHQPASAGASQPTPWRGVEQPGSSSGS